MSRSKVILQTILMLLLVCAGIAVGWKMGPGSAETIAAPDAADPHAGHDHSGHNHGVAAATTSGDKHVPLSREAAMSLDLKIGPVVLGDHARHISIPGKVISKPTGGHRTIASPVTGVVREVAATTGTAVSPDSKLFSIEITDQELLDTQTSVLDTMARLKVLLREADRLQPLVQDGIVGGAKLRDANYEKDQLLTRLATLQQSLTSYGFGPEQLAVLAKQRTLVRSVTVEANPTKNTKPPSKKNSPDKTEESLPAPKLQPTLQLQGPANAKAKAKRTGRTVQVAYADVGANDSPNNSEDSITDSQPDTKNNLPVDKIHAQVGQTVSRGDPLCTLGNYSELLVEGSAFNKDLTLLADLLTTDGRVTVRFGHRVSGEHSHDRERDDLEILYIDGEVDPTTQTVKFYVQLENEVLHRKPSSDGGEYITWLFRPGQNVHIRVPAEQWNDVLRVPRDAVVTQGPNAFVFRRIGGTMDEDHSAHDHDGDGHPDHKSDDHDASTDDHAGHDHDGDGKPDHIAEPVPHDHDGDGIPDHGPHAHDEEIYLEFEPVPVRIIHQDDAFVVLANDGEIQSGDIISQNNAYQLFLASEMNTAGGGGGHDHGHEH